MNIGIDLDGVIFDSEEEFRVYSEIYDILDLKANNMKNYKKLKFNSSFLPEYEIEHILINVHKEGVSKR